MVVVVVLLLVLKERVDWRGNGSLTLFGGWGGGAKRYAVVVVLVF